MYLEIKDLSKYWIIDIETDGLILKRLAKYPSNIWVCVLRNCKTNQVIKIYNEKQFRAFLGKINNDYFLVGHNILSFDIPVLNRLWSLSLDYNRCIDTQILSFLYWPKIPGGHSLEAWGARLKTPKYEFNDWSKLTQEMVDYCVQDTYVTRELHKTLVFRLRSRGFSEFSCRVEHKFLSIIDKQETTGFAFDIQRARVIYCRLRTREHRLGDKIRQIFPAQLIEVRRYKYRVKQDGSPYASFLRHCKKYPNLEHNEDGTYSVYERQEFNIASPAQRLERLYSLGFVPKRFNKKGNPETGEDAVREFAEERPDVPELALMADWLSYNGRANMVHTWMKAYSPVTKAIHGKVWTCGAGSRRCTHTGPNTANIPSVEALYGHQTRGLWTARPNRVMCGIDASGLEGRVNIHYLASKEAEEYMLNDPHTTNSLALTEALQKEISRRPSKNIFYAFIYGAQDPKLGAMVGGGPKEGAIVRRVLFDKVPGLEALVRSVQDEWKKQNTFIQTIDGGYVRCPSPHAALNYKFQSCGAIIMKIAAIYHANAVEKHGLDGLKVGDIHDEWQWDCRSDHAEAIGQLGTRAITKAGEYLKLNIALDGEYKIGRNWAETH